MQVMASSCARRWFCPRSASLWSQDLSEMLKDVSLTRTGVPTQVFVLNTISLTLQQWTASSSSESQLLKAPLICCSHSFGGAGWSGDLGVAAAARRGTTRVLLHVCDYPFLTAPV